jgi:periplasmic divalent cation tolerance protein
MSLAAVVVLVTAPAGEKAAAIARKLVESRLAACVNIVPTVRSIYWWKGRLCDDRECLLVIKTTHAAFPRLKKRILAIHPYDCPEVLALRVTAGSQAYLRWLAGEVA